MNNENIVLAVVSAVIGWILSELLNYTRRHIKERRELKENDNVIVSGGDWRAAWQTSVDGNELINTEDIDIIQKGKTLRIRNKDKSPENPIGGFKWDSEMRFLHGRDVLGWYFALKEENNSSCGIMFYNYDSVRKLFIGKWVGSAYDGPLLTGFVVISKDRQKSLDILSKVMKENPSKVTVISQAFGSTA